MTHQQQTAFENIVGKGEIARNEQFLLFPQCFLFTQVMVSPFVHIFNIISLFAAEFEKLKIGITGKGLKDFSLRSSEVRFIWYRVRRVENFITLSQTTNFRLFKTERVCERQFFNYMQMVDSSPQGVENICGKRRNCLLQASSSFPEVFPDDFYCRHLKIRACLGKSEGKRTKKWSSAFYGTRAVHTKQDMFVKHECPQNSHFLRNVTFIFDLDLCR